MIVWMVYVKNSPRRIFSPNITVLRHHRNPSPKLSSGQRDALYFCTATIGEREPIRLKLWSTEVEGTWPWPWALASIVWGRCAIPLWTWCREVRPFPSTRLGTSVLSTKTYLSTLVITEPKSAARGAVPFHPSWLLLLVFLVPSSPLVNRTAFFVSWSRLGRWRPVSGPQPMTS